MLEPLMKTRFTIAVVIALALAAFVPQLASACPSCADAPRATGGPDDEGNSNPAAYNHSIYVMVGVPYTCLAVIAFLVCRGMKKNEEYRRAHGWGDAPAPAPLQSPVPS
jgi:hypothetical protein